MLFARATSDYGHQIRLWPGSVLEWGSETLRTTVPGETRTLVESVFVPHLDYLRGLSTFAGSPITISNTNIENAMGLATALSVAITLGLDETGDLDDLVRLVEAIGNYHEVFVSPPNWGGLITSPRMAAELAEIVIRHQADMPAGVISDVQAILAEEATFDDSGHSARTVKWQATPSSDPTGDTGEEENGWAARAMHAGILWTPGHGSAATWTANLPNFLAGTYAIEADGLAGWNMLPDPYYPGSYCIVNHSIVHPRYEVSGIQSYGAMRRVSRLFSAAYQSMPHADDMYLSIYTNRITAGGGIRWPQGDDAGRRNLSQWGVTALIAIEGSFVSPATGMAAARAHFALMAQLQDDNPSGDGRIFQNIDVAEGTSRVDQEYRTVHKFAEALLHLDYLETQGIT